MRIRKRSFAGIVLVGLALAAVPAGATTWTTTSFPSWQTQLIGTFTEIDFGPVTNSNYNSNLGITLSGFTFTGPTSDGYYLVGSQGAGPSALYGSADAGASINVTTPAGGENALLLSLGTSGSTPITLTLSDGESFSVTTPLFGFALSQDITSFSLSTSAGSQVYINDLAYGASALAQDSGGGDPGPDPSDTPENATIVLMSGGLLILFASPKKWRSILLQKNPA